MKGEFIPRKQIVTGCSRVSSCSRSSKASSVLSEKVAAEKAARVSEVSLLQESGSLAQERLRLEYIKKKLL